MTVADAIKQLSELECTNIYMDIWHVEDIQDGTLTDQQVLNVISRMEATHDANIGVNWESIEEHRVIETQHHLTERDDISGG